MSGTPAVVSGPLPSIVHVRARRTPRVKVCCITNVAEAWTAIDAGASALGLVTAMPSGTGVISDQAAAEIARQIPPGIDTFLLTSRQDAVSITDQHRQIRTTTLQLVDQVEPSELRRLRADLPGIRLVQVIHVTGEDAIANAETVAGLVDAVLLDSGNPLASPRELGGTGRRHNWEISRRIRESLEIPVFLAGGLSPANAAQAVNDVGPYGVDICNGLRVNGRLDAQLLRDFFRALGLAPLVERHA
jgi:phosphoribosylanthranilate isomerase